MRLPLLLAGFIRIAIIRGFHLLVSFFLFIKIVFQGLTAFLKFCFAQFQGLIIYKVIVGLQGFLIGLLDFSRPAAARMAGSIALTLLCPQLVQLILQLIFGKGTANLALTLGDSSILFLLHAHQGKQVFTQFYFLFQTVVADAGKLLKISIGLLLLNLTVQRVSLGI